MDNLKNCFIETYSGKKFHILDPKPREISIIDIAHALSMQVRFTGHVKRFYSVAEHSLMASSLCPKNRLWALMHDASEAYLADMSTPLKYFSQLGTLYKEIEERLMHVILTKYGLPLEMPKEVHEADQIMLFSEKKQLMGELPWEGLYGDSKVVKMELLCMSPAQAKTAFLAAFKQLTGEKVHESKSLAA